MVVLSTCNPPTAGDGSTGLIWHRVQVCRNGILQLSGWREQTDLLTHGDAARALTHAHHTPLDVDTSNEEENVKCDRRCDRLRAVDWLKYAAQNAMCAMQKSTCAQERLDECGDRQEHYVI